MKSVVEFLENNAIRNGTKVAVSHNSQKITYAELNSKVNQFSRLLQQQGLDNKDNVCIFLNKSISKILAIFAVLKSGASVSIINQYYKFEQIKKIIQSSCCKLLITNEILFTPIKNKLGLINTFFLTDEDNSDIFCIDDRDIGNSLNPKDTGVTIFTSGSSGESKGVMISNENLVNRAITEANDYSLSTSDNILNFLPFSFDVGLNQLLSSFYAGANLVLHNFLFVKSLIKCIKTNNITGISAVPTFWVKLLSEKHLLDINDFNKLRYITISGGSLALPYLQQLMDLFKGVEIIKTYGQTETFRSTMLFCRSVENSDKIGSIGRAIKGVKLMVADLNVKRICDPGQTGELIHSGVGIMTGYMDGSQYGNKLTKISSLELGEPIEDKDCILTGDSVHMDEDGYVYYHGRKDDMVKISGMRLYPKEVEDALLLHPYIRSAAVWGVNDILEQTHLFAVVEREPESKLELSELNFYCNQAMPQYMIPKKIFFIDALPLKENGKVDIQTLKRTFTAEYV